MTKRYLMGRVDCPIACGGSFITKAGLLAHMRTIHKFTYEELTWPRRFFKEVQV